MNTTVRFRDHDLFHRSALYMASLGAVAGFAMHLSEVSHSPWALPVVATAAVCGMLAGRLGYTPRAVLGRGALLGMGTAGLMLLPQAGDTGYAMASFCLLFGAAIAWGLRGRRLLVAVAVGAASALLAHSALLSIVNAQQLSALPAWAVSTLAGAAFSFMSVLALLPQHVDVVRDPVNEAYAGLRDKTSGEIAELVRRGHSLWNDSTVGLSHDSVNHRTLQEGVLRLFEVARRWQDVEQNNNPEIAVALAGRMEVLQARIDAAEDDVVRTQYRHAHTALAEQLRYLKDIGTSRERVLARMHNYLAAMERLRLAVVNLESANVSRDTVDVKPLLSTVEELGRDIDTFSDMLGESTPVETAKVTADVGEQVAHKTAEPSA